MYNYIQLKLASPKKILSWCERLLPNNKNIGEIKKPMRIKKKTDT